MTQASDLTDDERAAAVHRAAEQVAATLRSGRPRSRESRARTVRRTGG